jgi:small subunit ribosomal protein S5e
LSSYLTVNAPKAKVFLPHTAGRYAIRRFKKVTCPIVERVVNSLMRNGRNNGKKQMAVRIRKQTLEIISLLTNANPIQVLVDAIT